MEKVNRMAVDPFQVIFFNDYNAKEEKTKSVVQYETDILDEAITKIGTLLVLGFGEAGSYIMTKNLS
jgi:hypothetical protein